MIYLTVNFRVILLFLSPVAFHEYLAISQKLLLSKMKIFWKIAKVFPINQKVKITRLKSAQFRE